MQIEGSISVGVAHMTDECDRVTLVTNASKLTMSTEFARHVAIQLIMSADYIDERTPNFEHPCSEGDDSYIPVKPDGKTP